MHLLSTVIYCLLHIFKSGFVWEPTLPGERLCKPGMGGASSRFPNFLYKNNQKQV